MKSRNRRKAIYMTSLAVSGMLAVTGISAYGDALSGTGDLTISLEYAGKAIPSAKVELYYVGPWNSTGSWDYGSDFAGCDISISEDVLDDNAAEQLYSYAAEQNISSLEQVTDGEGRAVYSDLGTGLYLVAQDGWSVENPAYEEFDPFLVSVPFLVDNAYTYSIEAKPKTEMLPEETATESETTPEETTASQEETTGEAETTPEETQPATEPEQPTEPASEETISTEEDPSHKPGGELGDGDESWSTAASDEETTAPIETETEDDPSHRPGGQLGDDDSGHLPITGMVVWPITVFSILGMLFVVAGWVDNRRREEKE